MNKTCIAIGLFVAALATTACEPPQTAPTLVTTPAPAATDAAPLRPQGSPVSILDRKS